MVNTIFLGFDEYGEQVHSTIYPHLMTNVPKEVMEYPDYTFQQHFGKPMSSYVDVKTVRDYIEGLFYVHSVCLEKNN